MKNLFKSFVVLLAVMAAVPSFAQKANNTLTEKEKKQGWTLLFNGKDFTGWRQCNSTRFILQRIKMCLGVIDRCLEFYWIKTGQRKRCFCLLIARS